LYLENAERERRRHHLVPKLENDGRDAIVSIVCGIEPGIQAIASQEAFVVSNDASQVTLVLDTTLILKHNLK